MKNKIVYAEVFMDFKDKLFNKGKTKIIIKSPNMNKGIYYNEHPPEKNVVVKVKNKWIYVPPTGLD